jgi:hypothetical protein
VLTVELAGLLAGAAWVLFPAFWFWRQAIGSLQGQGASWQVLGQGQAGPGPWALNSGQWTGDEVVFFFSLSKVERIKVVCLLVRQGASSVWRVFSNRNRTLARLGIINVLDRSLLYGCCFQGCIIVEGIP